MFLPALSHKRILIAPLDWGMGHTTRCMPIVRHLEKQGHTVVLAGNEQQRTYWKRSCPHLAILPLDGYDVRYGKKGSGVAIGLQIPKVLDSIKREHVWVKKIISEYGIDGVISDNRYGLYNSYAPTVILTHQLEIISGLGKGVDTALRSIHYKYLRRFDECWVPDVEAAPNLAGRLSHPAKLPGNVKYIGLLSALEEARAAPTEEHLLILLSGPEPQRGILSQLLWQQVKDSKLKAVFVEGSKTAVTPEYIPDQIKWHSLLGANEVQQAMNKATYVVCRSGYSTLMDLTLLDKKAILIPTPGQSEQEYLGKSLREQGVYPSYHQKGFSLTAALAEAAAFPFRKPPYDDVHNNYEQVLASWVKGL